MKQFFCSVLALCVLCVFISPNVLARTPVGNDAPLANLHRDASLIPESLHGVWHSEGYGWVLTIGTDGVSMVDVTPGGCVDAQDIFEEYETYFHTYDLNSAQDRLGLRGKFEDYTYFFARTDALPQQCEIELASTPRTNFEYLRDVMAAHYAFFDTRGLDWDAIVAEAEPQIRNDMSDDELWPVLRSMIAPIDDGHVTFSRVVDGRRVTFMPGRGRTQNSIIPLALSRGERPGPLFGQWYEDYKSQILDDVLAGNGKIIARDRVIYGMIDDEVGYLNILKMGGFVEGAQWSLADFEAETEGLNAALDEALLHMQSAKSMVVDATYIGGGFDYLGREIAARFTRVPVLGSHRGPADAQNPQSQPLYTYPSDRPSFHGPVVILSSNLTMSASESFIMHMKAMPHVTHMGETTRGALSEVLTKTLPNGWSVSISNEAYLDGAKISWEGKGLQPDKYLRIFDSMDMFKGHAQAVKEAASELKVGASS